MQDDCIAVLKCPTLPSAYETKNCHGLVLLKRDHLCPSLPFQELCNEMESKVHTYTNVRNAIHRMLEGSDVARGSSTEHSMCILEVDHCLCKNARTQGQCEGHEGCLLSAKTTRAWESRCPVKRYMVYPCGYKIIPLCNFILYCWQIIYLE